MRYEHFNGCLFIILICYKLTIKSHTDPSIFVVQDSRCELVSL